MEAQRLRSWLGRKEQTNDPPLLCVVQRTKNSQPSVPLPVRVTLCRRKGVRVWPPLP